MSAHAALAVRDDGLIPDVLRTVHHVDAFTSPSLVACQQRSIVEPDAVLYVKARVIDGPLDIVGDERGLGYFLLEVEDVLEDSAAEWEGGVRVTSGIQYRPVSPLDAPSVRATLAALARLGDVADERVERRRRFFLRNARLLGDRVDDVTLSCHKQIPPLST